MLIVTQAVQHGNLSSGTHPGRNVPDDGFFFLCVSAGGHVSLPLLLKRTGTLQNPSSHGGGVHINIFEIAFQCAPSKNHRRGIPLPKRCRNRCKRTCVVLCSAMRETLARTLSYVIPPSRKKTRFQCSSLCASTSIYQAGCLF